MEANDLFQSLLSDPEKLQSAIAMASSLLGGSGPAPSESTLPVPIAPASPPAPAPPAAPPAPDPTNDLLLRMMPQITRIFQSTGQAISPEKKALLLAIKPFLSPAAGQQIDHGMQLVVLAHLASTVLGSFKKDDEPEGGRT